MADDVTNLENWAKMWEKACEDKLFGDTPKPAPPEGQESFFGLQQSNAYTRPNDADVSYWNKVHKLGGLSDPLDDFEGHPADIQTDDMVSIQENTPVEKKELVQTTKPDNKSVAAITDDLGKLANPVHASTREADTRRRVTPNWAGGPDVLELHNMKISLYELESKVAADPMLEDKKSKKIIAQIDALYKKIDELSDSLNPEFRQEYLS